MTESNGEETFFKSFPQYKEGGEQIQPILEKSSLLSSESRIKIPDVNGNKLGEPRTLALRRLRMELVDKVQSTPVKLSEEQVLEIKSLKETQALTFDPDEQEKIREQIKGIFVAKNSPRKEIVVKGHERDVLAQEFITNQVDLHVDLGKLGLQFAMASVLPSPDQEAARQKPPIVLIPGISNDLENMGMLPQEMAFEGRNVIFIGYPENWMGDVTNEFADAAQKSGNYEPHTTFFKRAIEKIKKDPGLRTKIGDFEKFDIWGYSAGSVI